MKGQYVLLTFFVLITITNAQVPGYLGSTPPSSDTALIFAKDIVSISDNWEEKLVITPDGKEIIWGIHDKKDYHRPYIMHVKFENGKWSKPDTISFSKKRKLGWPMISPDGTMLFMEEITGKTENGIWADIVCSKKEEGGWGEPTSIIPKIDSKCGFGLAQMTLDGTFYFYDRYARTAYSAKLVDGKIVDPEKLPYHINPAVELFVSPNNDYLLYRPLGWDISFHISYRSKDGKWSFPLSIKENVKNKDWIKMGAGPTISPDGKYIFFSTITDGTWINSEIYWISTSFVDEIRKKAFWIE